MHWYSIFISLTLVCYLALIYLVLREGWQGNRTNQAFTLYLVSMVVWMGAYFMVSVSSTPAQALLWYRVVAGVVSGQFILYFIFTRALLHIEGARGIAAAGPVVWAMTLALALVFNQKGVFLDIHRDAGTGLFVPTFGPMMLWLSLPDYSYLGYGVYNLVREYRTTRSDLQRRRIQYLLVGLAVVLLGISVNYSPRLQPYPLDVVANLINAIIIAYAILRFQLLDIQLVIRKGLLYFIPTALIAAGYFLVIFFALPVFRTLSAQQVLLTITLAALTAVAIQPLRDRLQSWVDRLFFREKYDSGVMLQRLSATVASVLDLDRLTGMILDAVVTTLHVDKAAILIKHEESGEFRLLDQRGLEHKADIALGRDHPIVDWLSQREEVLTRHDMELLPQFKALWGQEKEDLRRIGAEIFIPLKAGDELVGLFAMGRKLSDQGYSQDDRLTLTTLANQTAVAIANARLYEETQRRLRESEMLNRVRASIISAFELDKTLQVIIDSAVQATLHAQKGSLHLLDEEHDLLVMRAGCGFSPEAMQAGSLRVDEGYTGWAFRHQKPIIIANTRADRRAASTQAPEIQETQSAMCIPLVVKGKCIGAITLHNVETPGAFTEDDLQLLSNFAIQAAIAIENATLYEAVQRELAERKRMEQALQDLNVTLEERVRMRTSDLQVLYEISQKIGYTLDSAELFRMLLGDLHRAVPFDLAACALQVGDRCEVFLQPARPLTDAIRQEVQGHLDAALRCGSDLEAGQSVRWLEADPPAGASLPLTRSASRLEVPLVAGDNQERLGLLLVLAEQAEAFSADDERLLTTLANQASVAVQRLRAILAAEQQRQESLLERLPEGVLLLDAKQRIVLANPVGQQYLRLLTDARVGEVLTNLGERSVQELLGPLPEAAGFHEVVPKGASHQAFEIVSKVMESGPQAGGWVVILRDVAERKRAEEDKARLEEQLRQAQKMEAVGLLAGGVAHEFNNLLTVIQGNAELALLQEDAARPLEKELSTIQGTARKAARLTHQLLAFSRRQMLQPSEVDLNKLIRGFVEMLERVIGENIQLQLDLCSGLAIVLADGNAIEQALMNLAVNARDAMHEGGVLRFETSTVEADASYCQAHREAKPGSHVRLSVVDTGTGMDEETQRHIFEPFFTTKEVGKGTGLGLAMVYGVVKQHGGWIEVDSHVGKGSRFDLYFPAHLARTQVKEAAALPKNLPGGTETILLAEDEQDVREFARRVLEGLGYRVLVASNGAEAVQAFAANREQIQLLILDVVMPKVSGPKSYEAISGIQADVPVMYISGYSESMAGIAVHDRKVQLLLKPFSVEELGNRVRKALDGAR